MNGEMESMWKEVVVNYFKVLVLFRHLLEGTREYKEETSARRVCVQPRFEPNNSGIGFRRIVT
jgi:hypothetical protein